jgi:hypothetical protein
LQDYANEVVEFESNITSARHVKTKKKGEHVFRCLTKKDDLIVSRRLTLSFSGEEGGYTPLIRRRISNGYSKAN